VAHYLSKITRKGVAVKHESPSTSPDVLVSWPSRCPLHKRLDFKQLGFPNPKDQKKPMVDWANKQLSGKCAYKNVIHLVRHPLKFLSSNFAFGQCLECWALVEHLTVPSIAHQTAKAREAIVKNRRRWGAQIAMTGLQLHACLSFVSATDITFLFFLFFFFFFFCFLHSWCRLYEQTGGRDWDASMRRTLLHAFMLYWVTWNTMIAGVADERLRVEDGNLRKVCERYGLGTGKECARDVKEENVKKASHGGGQDKVTWAEIEAIDAPLASKMWDLAKSYGYSREPPPK
jgi:hypothetical protein